MQESQISELQDEIKKLKEENLRLKSEKNRTIERIVEIPPADYQKVKQQLSSFLEEIDSLRNRCRVMEHILCYGEISPMSQIIKEYKSMSTFYLQQLTKEIEIYRINEKERSVMLDFLEYLQSVTKDIESMLIVED